MDKLINIGEYTARYGIVYILLAFGIFKFTNTEAQGIKDFVDHSPFLHWMNSLFSARTTSAIIGILEIIAALGIGLRFMSPRLAFYASLLGCLIFLVTLSFLVTTPGMIAKTEWLWLPDGFLIKDIALLGFCLWSAGEAYRAMQQVIN